MARTKQFAAKVVCPAVVPFRPTPDTRILLERARNQDGARSWAQVVNWALRKALVHKAYGKRVEAIQRDLGVREEAA